jgi:hypothetical protein
MSPFEELRFFSDREDLSELRDIESLAAWATAFDSETSAFSESPSSTGTSLALASSLDFLA